MFQPFATNELLLRLWSTKNSKRTVGLIIVTRTRRNVRKFQFPIRLLYFGRLNGFFRLFIFDFRRINKKKTIVIIIITIIICTQIGLSRATLQTTRTYKKNVAFFYRRRSDAEEKKKKKPFYSAELQ